MSIEQNIDFAVPAAQVYAALTDSEQFSAFTGAPARIEAVAGGEFSGFDGQIVGRNLELVPGERVVQAWRVAGWAPGSWSIVRFELAQEGESTRVTLHHGGFPEDFRGHLEGGWHKMYWEPLRAYLG